MKRLIFVLGTILLVLSSPASFVSAAEPYDSYEVPTIEEARAVAEVYAGIGGIDENISPPGSDLTRLEIREMIPTMFVRQLQNNSYTPAEVAENALGYTAIVWSGDRPISLMRIEKADEKSLRVAVATAGGVPEFLDGLARMRARTTSGDVCVISMYGIVNYYFYAETADGPMAMPMTVYEDAIKTYGRYYTDEILIPFDEFEAAYTEQLHMYDTTPPEMIPLGGDGILENLPPAKMNAALRKWVPIVIGLIVGVGCCAILCITLERGRKKKLHNQN